MNPTFLLLGGSALLIFALGELSRNIQYIAGSKFRAWLGYFNENRFISLLLGVVLAFFLGSSSAVTVMLVGLASARLLTLPQVLAVTLGAGVGTTLILHLIALRLSDYGLILIAIGVFAEAFLKKERPKRFGRILFILGLLFFCLELLVFAGEQLHSFPQFNATIRWMGERPLVAMTVATLITALVHSSSATLALVMTLASDNNAPLSWAMPWVLGANLGTASTAFVVSRSLSAVGRQAALANFLQKAIGVTLGLIFLSPFTQFLDSFDVAIGWKIAFSHTAFNAILALVLFPLIPLAVRLVEKWIPPNAEDGEFKLRYLDKEALLTPALALEQGRREILRLGELVIRMVEKCTDPFHSVQPSDVDALREMDRLIDFLNKNIRHHLTEMSQAEMSPNETFIEMQCLMRTQDLENVGDTVVHNLLPMVEKCRDRGYRFSDEGREEIRIFHRAVANCLRLSVTVFENQTDANLSALKRSLDGVDSLAIELASRHFQRLHSRVSASVESSSVHQDVIGSLQRIAFLSGKFLGTLTQDESTPKTAVGGA